MAVMIARLLTMREELREISIGGAGVLTLDKLLPRVSIVLPTVHTNPRQQTFGNHVFPRKENQERK